MEQNKIFREASLSRISNPEELNAYMKVNSPGVWMVLTAVILLLVGVILWGVFGVLTTVVEGVMVVENDTAYFYIPSTAADDLHPGMEVWAGERYRGNVVAVGTVPSRAEEAMGNYAVQMGGFSPADMVCAVAVTAQEEDGVFAARIVTEVVAPITIVIN